MPKTYFHADGFARTKTWQGLHNRPDEEPANSAGCCPCGLLRNAKQWSDLPNDPPNDTNSRLLDFLLAGYSGNSPNNQHIQQQQQFNSNSALMFTDNPDGPLSGPLASQESAMFMKPAQLAKDKKVLRIIDFVDKIVTSTEDKTIRDLGSTKLVIS